MTSGTCRKCDARVVCHAGEVGAHRAHLPERTSIIPPAPETPMFDTENGIPAGCACWRCLDQAGERIWWMVVCATCGNKRCPHATDHDLACTGSNEPGQPGSAYEHGSGAATARRMSTAIAPDACDHGGNYRDGDDWHCLTCPHVWPVSGDPAGYGDRAGASPRGEERR